MAWRGSALFAFGIPGPREIVLVALVVMALYGRNGTRLLMSTRYGRSLQPWLRLLGVGSRPATARTARAAATNTAIAKDSGPRPRHGRLFWALTITAAAAMAAWVATRIVILAGSSAH